ncbi:hypothetical protein AMECASPLE_029809 [Ameca splendens]|uniref:Uncharacterized protein n=1 Tax=Ameca splendens TaxID=208324 RepID=A0ABV0ZRF1_9TELE
MARFLLSKPLSLLFSNVTNHLTFMPLFLTPEGFLMIASWFLKFLRQTLFSATFPLVSSHVTHLESGQLLQQLPKVFPQLPYNNSAAGRLQHSLHMSTQTSILCSLLNDLSALR